MFKRLVVLILTISSLMLISTPIAFAATDPLSDACQNASSSSVCAASSDNPLYGPTGLITKATQIIAILVGIAAVIMIIIGGFKYVTSTGDPNSVNSAKNTILYAIIGLVVSIVAESIVIFVLQKL